MQWLTLPTVCSRKGNHLYSVHKVVQCRKHVVISDVVVQTDFSLDYLHA